jgi:DNA-binding NarL/FixJ family response regulator
MGDGTRSGGRLTFVGESDDKARDGAARMGWRTQPASLVLRSVPASTDRFARDSIDPAFGGLDRRTWSADPSHHVIACVDIQSNATVTGGELTPDVLWGLAVRRMERCIRPADRVCMLGGSRFAVCFGNGAHRVAPNELGTRLARAMGNHLVVGTTALDLRVRVGVGAGTMAVEARHLTGAAIASTRSARRVATHRQRRDLVGSSVVAVTTVPDPHELLSVSGPGRAPAVIGSTGTRATGTAAAPTTHRLLRRTFFPPPGSTEHTSAASAARTGRVAGTETYRAMAYSHIAGLTILVVDPAVSTSDMPRSAVQGVAAVARRLGVCPILSQADRPDTVVDDLSVSEADAVVLILHPDTASPSIDAGTPWEHPARLARALVDAGASVIALSVGASAAAVAACVEQGAAGVLQIDALSDELVTVAKATGPRSNGSPRANGNGTNGAQRGRRQLPPPFDALIHLTSTERKVLFHMMEGRAAGDIAAVLVVSLTTVRSHIRSILRKLNVNSQLAAVAIANGADPRSDPRADSRAAAG